MEKCIFALFALSLLSGCASSKPAAIPQGESSKTASLYYQTVEKNMATSAATAERFFAATADLASAISAPLAPVEAVESRVELTVKGDKQSYDIGKPAPPEALLPLAKERTKQVQALAYAMRGAVMAARVEIAAPPGFVGPASKSEAGLDFDLFDYLPNSYDESVSN